MMPLGVIDTGLPAISETIRETIEIDLSAFFTDVEGDELTFTVTLSDDSPLSTIGLSYDPRHQDDHWRVESNWRTHNQSRSG